jgi:hypothetical protein
MTLQEAYDKALKIDGKYASVDESMQTFEGRILHSFSVRSGDLYAYGYSYKECFDKIAQQDPEKAKADKIAKLKAELKGLES